jgi:hypothetical protein
MGSDQYNAAKTYPRPAAMSLLVAIACALVLLAPGESFSSQQVKKPLKCVNVSRRWQLCGSGSRTHLTAGVGIRFNRIDPNGRIVASRSYDDCSKLAADGTLPADIRAKAARQCKQGFHLTARRAAR